MRTSFYLSILLFIFFAVAACSKNKSNSNSDSIDAQPASSYTAHMAGTRIWHGRAHRYVVSQDTSVPGTFVNHLYDSAVNHAFDLVVLNNTTVQFEGDELHMDSVNTTDHFAYFCRTLHDYLHPAHKYIIYYYLADSMSYHFANDYHALDDYVILSTP